jgi:hypothetical protein
MNFRKLLLVVALVVAIFTSAVEARRAKKVGRGGKKLTLIKGKKDTGGGSGGKAPGAKKNGECCYVRADIANAYCLEGGQFHNNDVMFKVAAGWYDMDKATFAQCKSIVKNELCGGLRSDAGGILSVGGSAGG